MNTEKLKGLQIAPEEKRRPQRAFWSIVIAVAVVLLATVVFIKPWAKDNRELASGTAASADNSVSTNAVPATPAAETSSAKNFCSGIKFRQRADSQRLHRQP